MEVDITVSFLLCGNSRVSCSGRPQLWPGGFSCRRETTTYQYQSLLNLQQLTSNGQDHTCKYTSIYCTSILRDLHWSLPCPHIYSLYVEIYTCVHLACLLNIPGVYTSRLYITSIPTDLHRSIYCILRLK